MKQTFGEHIRQLRLSKGWTLTKLAAQLDMDSANLSKIENGKREFDQKRIAKLANAFDLDVNELTEEFLSDQFAKAIYASKSSLNSLKLAEEKVRYLQQKNAKQSSINL
ncbi:MAG: helix-turn-helix domain-containing protein [Bacteroidales bacterium]|nr:helix-turn-helix domain-containing protein [Bacteroidales bacterium]